MCCVVCQVLNISGSNITGALPLTWGSPGALPALVDLELGHNSITGQPATISLPIQSSQHISDLCYVFGIPLQSKLTYTFIKQGQTWARTHVLRSKISVF